MMNRFQTLPLNFNLRRYNKVQVVDGVNVTSDPLLKMVGLAEFEYPCDLGVGPGHMLPATSLTRSSNPHFLS
jgi:hypothetical protein